MCCDFFVFLGV